MRPEHDKLAAGFARDSINKQNLRDRRFGREQAKRRERERARNKELGFVFVRSRSFASYWISRSSSNRTESRYNGSVIHCMGERPRWSVCLSVRPSVREKESLLTARFSVLNELFGDPNLAWLLKCMPCTS